MISILRCQQCKGALEEKERYLHCDRCQKSYPIYKGLIFMGFDKKEKENIRTIMDTEKSHQTDLNKIEEDLVYACQSFRLGKSAVNYLRSLTGRRSGLKVLEIGAGAGAMSWLLAENGFDLWLCEIEPNSLYSGFVYQHENLSLGKRIVCDAKILPFDNATFDVVFCKEFAHHIQNIDTLFGEVNRVLKNNGHLLLIEPILSLFLKQYFFQHPDQHHGHFYHSAREYFESFQANGFRIVKYGLYFYKEASHFPLIGRIKRRFNAEIRRGIRSFSDFFKYLYAAVVGGSMVVIAAKTKSPGTDKTSFVDIEIVPTSRLVLNDDYLCKVEPFSVLLKRANEEP